MQALARAWGASFATCGPKWSSTKNTAPAWLSRAFLDHTTGQRVADDVGERVHPLSPSTSEDG